MTLEPENRIRVPLYSKAIISEISPDVFFPLVVLQLYFCGPLEIPTPGKRECKFLPQGRKSAKVPMGKDGDSRTGVENAPGGGRRARQREKGRGGDGVSEVRCQIPWWQGLGGPRSLTFLESSWGHSGLLEVSMAMTTWQGR